MVTIYIIIKNIHLHYFKIINVDDKILWFMLILLGLLIKEYLILNMKFATNYITVFPKRKPTQKIPKKLLLKYKNIR